jgi:hypothetical protein
MPNPQDSFDFNERGADGKCHFGSEMPRSEIAVDLNDEAKGRR